MRALSVRNDEPQKASRPFDKDRDGFVIGEGCGIIILEELSFALKEGRVFMRNLPVTGAHLTLFIWPLRRPDTKAPPAVCRLR